VNKITLNVSILLTGLLLSVVHYELKPRPSDRDIRDQAQEMSRRVEWQGQIAPDFALKTTRGDHFQLSDNIGKKVIVLNFFATWCGPCRAEMPEMNRYFNEHKSQPFLLLAIDAEERPDTVDTFLTDLKLDFPAGVDAGPIRKQYGVDSYPTTVVIGVDGKVQFYESGALANADVAFDELLRQNLEQIKIGHVISPEQYRLQAQQNLKVSQQQSAEEEIKLDDRGKRIVAQMDCPCGCEDKVKACTCNTYKKIQKALASEDFKDKKDDEIMRDLNKRFCSRGM
jgi:thiol-disulfide isomerase/thioredoxin